MLGSGIHTVCNCHSCCSNKYNSIQANTDNLPDKIHLSYSGVPSFIEPPINWDVTEQFPSYELQSKVERRRNNPGLVVQWQGELDLLIDVDGNRTREYFKYFDINERPSFIISGTVDAKHQYPVFGFPPTVETIELSSSFNKEFEIVAVYVSQIKIASTEESISGQLPSDNFEGTNFENNKNIECLDNNCCSGRGSPGCGTHYCIEELRNNPQFPNNLKCYNPTPTNPTGNVNGSCYIAKSTPCCENPLCSTTVCQTPGFEYCCQPVEEGGIWDSNCVQKANELCNSLCGMNECQASVCAEDSFCCEKQWDASCADRAQTKPECNCSEAQKYSKFNTSLPVDIAGYAWFADIIIQPKFSGFFSGGVVFPNGGYLQYPILNTENIVSDWNFYGGNASLPRSYSADPSAPGLPKPRFTSVKSIFYSNTLDSVTLENFYTTPDASKRQSYLVPTTVNEITECLWSPTNSQWAYNIPGMSLPRQLSYTEPHAKELIDRKKTIDGCNLDLVKTVYPSSPIRNNKHPLSVQYMNGNSSLPYGVYQLNVGEVSGYATQNVCPCGEECDPRFCLNSGACCNNTSLPCTEQRAKSGCIYPSAFPNCPCNEECQTEVCQLDPFCCQSAWDSSCASRAAELESCLPDGPPPACGNVSESCFEPHSTPFCNDLGCCQTVCAFKLECCEQAWTDECVELAQFLCTSSLVQTSTSIQDPFVCQPFELFSPQRNLYNIIPYQNGTTSNCFTTRSSCGFRYECTSPTLIYNYSLPLNPPDVIIRRFGFPNYNCGYDFMKSPGCITTERPIDSIFVSVFLPEDPCIIYYTDSGSCASGSVFGQKYCYKFDNSGEVSISSDMRKVFCSLPATNFPKLSEYSDALFASSTTIIITPVPSA